MFSNIRIGLLDLFCIFLSENIRRKFNFQRPTEGNIYEFHRMFNAKAFDRSFTRFWMTVVTHWRGLARVSDTWSVPTCLCPPPYTHVQPITFASYWAANSGRELDRYLG